MSLLSFRLGRILADENVSVHGFADLREHQADLAAFGGEIVKDYPVGIGIGIALPNSIVDFLDRRSDRNVAALYQSYGYELINRKLDEIAMRVSLFLNRQGHWTLPIPASERTDIANAIPTVSHKMIAHLAGLGWIGKSCLLVTPRYGPRIRFVSLLTHAPFKTNRPILGEQCGACLECTKACPPQAIKGVNYRDGDPREARFDFRKCQGYFDEMRKDVERKPVCGMCLYVCPHGRKR